MTRSYRPVCAIGDKAPQDRWDHDKGRCTLSAWKTSGTILLSLVTPIDGCSKTTCKRLQRYEQKHMGSSIAAQHGKGKTRHNTGSWGVSPIYIYRHVRHSYRSVQSPQPTVVPGSAGRGGSFIARAVFGSPFDPPVVALRNHRNSTY